MSSRGIGHWSLWTAGCRCRGWRPVAATSLAFVAGVLGWKGVDLPAQLYRVGLFHRQGLTLWDTQWYGGHWTLGYSVVFPPVAGVIGLRATEIVSAGIAALAFDRLVVGHFGPGARAGSAVFALGTLVPVAIGQVPFLLGEALALVGVLGDRPAAVAVGDPPRSRRSAGQPVGWRVPRPRRVRLAARDLARSPGERRLCDRRGGHPHRRPRRSVSRAGDDAVSRPRLRRGRDDLRRCRAVHAPATSARCGSARACMSRRSLPSSSCRRRSAATSTGWARPLDCPSRCASCGPLGGSCSPLWPSRSSSSTGGRRGARSPIGPTRQSKSPVLRARGGLRASPRQPARPGRDRPHGGALGGCLRRPVRTSGAGMGTPARHRRQSDLLHERGADASDLPVLAPGQRGALRGASRTSNSTTPQWRRDDWSKQGVPGLRPVWHNTNWRVYEVQGSPGIVSGPARAVALRGDTITLDVTAPGTIHLKERYSPRWAVTQGDGCTHEDSGGWLSIQALRPGPMRAQLRLFGPPGDAC